jgi:hypothetical protein
METLTAEAPAAPTIVSVIPPALDRQVQLRTDVHHDPVVDRTSCRSPASSRHSPQVPDEDEP